MAATTVILAAAWACGGDSGVGPGPAANFNAPSCTAGTACQFTDASTPAGEITAWTWNFGDANAPAADNTSNLQNPLHTYSQPGTYNVQLTVTSSAGSNNKTVPVTVTGTANQPPVANFDVPACVAGTPCGFHSTSSDPEGADLSATHRWDFAGEDVAETPDATHTFAAPGTYNVVLTVTDNQAATGTVTKPVVVTPATSQNCTTTGTFVDCTLAISGTRPVTVKFVMVSEACDFSGNNLRVTAPVSHSIFLNLCNRSPNEERTVVDPSGNPRVLQPGEQIVIRFSQGAGDPGDPPAGDPGIRIDGSQSANWTLNIDDGGLAGTQGEPDFNDAVVRVVATPQ